MNELGPAGDQVRRNVKRLRESQGLTKKDLSDRSATLGRAIPPLGIARLEAGSRRVDVDDLVMLASALRVGIPDLLGAPPACATCDGSPPSGFACKECGAEA